MSKFDVVQETSGWAVYRVEAESAEEAKEKVRKNQAKDNCIENEFGHTVMNTYLESEDILTQACKND